MYARNKKKNKRMREREREIKAARDETRMYECEYREKNQRMINIQEKKNGKKRKSMFVFLFFFCEFFSLFCILSSDFLA